MNIKSAAPVLFALAALALPPRTADACSPIYSGQTAVTESDTPECLTISGQDFYDDGMATALLTVSNGCDELVLIECVTDPNSVCTPTEVGAGLVSQVAVPTAGGTVQWTLADESGQTSYSVDGDWGGCGPLGPFGCSASRTRTDGVSLLALLGLLGLRKRARRSGPRS